MSIQSQEIYEIPLPSSGDYSEPGEIFTPEVIATLVLSAIIGVTMWITVLWRLPGKAGFTGAARWFWFLTLVFPLTTSFSLLAFVFFPWPVRKQKDKALIQLEELRRISQSQPKGIDGELEQLRHQIRRDQL